MPPRCAKCAEFRDAIARRVLKCELGRDYYESKTRSPNELAASAYAHADAMLATRNADAPKPVGPK